MFGYVPYDFAKKANPALTDILKSGVRYTFSPSDIYQQTDQMTLYRVPYSDKTFWTHYKCDINGALASLFSVEVLLIDQLDSRAILNHEHEMTGYEWFPLTWPLPSLSTPKEKGLFIRITHKVDPGTYQLCLSIIGFTNLFPNYPSYLLTHKDKPILLFQRNIASLEHTDTSYIIAKQKIREEYISHPYRIKMSKEYYGTPP